MKIRYTKQGLIYLPEDCDLEGYLAMGNLANTFMYSLLLLLFNNTNIADVGDAAGIRGSVLAGDFYLALTTTAPSDTAFGTECAYTSYARVDVVRSSSGFTVTSPNLCANAALVQFPQATGGSETAVGFNVVKEDTGTDRVGWGLITSPPAGLPIVTGVRPEFDAGALDINIILSV